MERLICLAIGYVCGLFQTSYIIGRLHKTDIREHGSGNAGTTNALRTFGKKAGILTLLGDCLKCVAAIVLVRVFLGKTYGDILPLLSLYAAAGCILGHNFPFYLKFRGGKGIAASVGFILAFDWRIFLICAVIFCAVLYDPLCVLMLSECLSGCFCGNHRSGSGRGLWHGCFSYHGNVCGYGAAYSAGFFPPQSKYYAAGKRHREPCLSWEKR